jgi:probable phosphoglycerate mutase
MRILIVRHGDPDYSIDSLTPTGWTEAEALAERLLKTDIDAIYLSPLGRAQDTAKPYLEKSGREAETLDFLREFSPRVFKPDDAKRRGVAWDWLPSDYSSRDYFYESDAWHSAPEFKEAGVKEEYDRVVSAFDELLKKHGYARCGRIYRAERPNHDTIMLVCHFGVESVLLSHILNVSPMTLWHSTCALPTSVTTLYTEERREGVVSFRIAAFGDTSHLYAKGLEPSFAARFCECYTDDTRHD